MKLVDLELNSMITELKPNQIFVFGSNLGGKHGGGAARQALESFGAYYSKGVGRQRQSYAIPTLDSNLERLPLEIISLYLWDFDDYAQTHPELEFLLTKIGTGIAGFTPQEMESIMPNFPSNVIIV